MLSSIKKLSGCRILAVDGEAGRVRDVYLDDDQWLVRYLVVDTSDWLSEQSVLISPSAVTGRDARDRAARSIDSSEGGSAQARGSGRPRCRRRH